jgi:hypothetical protein
VHNGSGAGWMACAAAPELPPDAALAAAAAAGCAAPDAAEGAAFELNNVLPYLVRAADQGADVSPQRRVPVLGRVSCQGAGPHRSTAEGFACCCVRLWELA